MKELILNSFFRTDDELFPFSSLDGFTTEQLSLLVSFVFFALGFFTLVLRLAGG